MKSLPVLLLVGVFAGTLASQSAGTPQARVYVEKDLTWEGKPLTGSGGLRSSAYIEIFYPDHRYVCAGVILGKSTKAQKAPYIIENEGFSLRVGTWTLDGKAIKTHSSYVHLEAAVSPYPSPVDKPFQASGASWAERGGPLSSAGKPYTEVKHLQGVEHLEEVAAEDSCHVDGHPADLGDAWTAYCHQSASKFH
jgi:hypothetical protein